MSEVGGKEKAIEAGGQGKLRDYLCRIGKT